MVTQTFLRGKTAQRTSGIPARVRTWLIRLTDSWDSSTQLMEFVAKHLPDKFYLQGDQRVSLRTGIFREVAANLIVHREYVNAHPCTFVISSGKVETENANNPHGEGLIDPNHFTPFPKNPAIAKFFIQLGRVDELGSGILNVTRFTKQYSGKRKSEFVEGNTFRMIIPVPKSENGGLNGGINEGLKSVLDIINKFPGVQGKEISVKLANRSIRTIEKQIKILIEYQMIERRGSRKNGGYFVIARRDNEAAE